MEAGAAMIGHEVWLETKYQGYHVSNFGRVIGRMGHILKPRPHSNGYAKFSPGIKQDAYIHVTVLETFVGPRPTDLHEADHLNDNRSDNRLTNLRWLDRKSNRDKRKLGKSLITRATVPLILASEEDVDLLAERYRVKRQAILNIKRGHSWRAR